MGRRPTSKKELPMCSSCWEPVQSGNRLRCSTCPAVFHRQTRCTAVPRCVLDKLTSYQCFICQPCFHCGVNDDREGVFCDICNRNFHIKCLDPPLMNVPHEDKKWFCEYCSSSRCSFCAISIHSGTSSPCLRCQSFFVCSLCCQPYEDDEKPTECYACSLAHHKLCQSTDCCDRFTDKESVTYCRGAFVLVDGVAVRSFRASLMNDKFRMVQLQTRPLPFRRNHYCNATRRSSLNLSIEFIQEKSELLYEMESFLGPSLLYKHVGEFNLEQFEYAESRCANEFFPTALDSVSASELKHALTKETVDVVEVGFDELGIGPNWVDGFGPPNSPKLWLDRNDICNVTEDGQRMKQVVHSPPRKRKFGFELRRRTVRDSEPETNVRNTSAIEIFRKFLKPVTRLTPQASQSSFFQQDANCAPEQKSGHSDLCVENANDVVKGVKPRNKKNQRTLPTRQSARLRRRESSPVKDCSNENHDSSCGNVTFEKSVNPVDATFVLKSETPSTERDASFSFECGNHDAENEQESETNCASVQPSSEQTVIVHNVDTADVLDETNTTPLSGGPVNISFDKFDFNDPSFNITLSEINQTFRFPSNFGSPVDSIRSGSPDRISFQELPEENNEFSFLL